MEQSDSPRSPLHVTHPYWFAPNQIRSKWRGDIVTQQIRFFRNSDTANIWLLHRKHLDASLPDTLRLLDQHARTARACVCGRATESQLGLDLPFAVIRPLALAMDPIKKYQKIIGVFLKQTVFLWQTCDAQGFELF